jgi:hypothetical protein
VELRLAQLVKLADSLALKAAEHLSKLAACLVAEEETAAKHRQALQLGPNTTLQTRTSHGNSRRHNAGQEIFGTQQQQEVVVPAV